MSSASGVNLQASIDKMHELEKYLVNVGEVLERVKGVTSNADQVLSNLALRNVNSHSLLLIREAITLAVGDPYEQRGD